MPAHLDRRSSNRLGGLAALVTAVLLAVSGAVAQPAGEPVTIGVSGPLTGQNAQYGAQWKKGFDLALEEVNRNGVKLE